MGAEGADDYEEKVDGKEEYNEGDEGAEGDEGDGQYQPQSDADFINNIIANVNATPAAVKPKKDEVALDPHVVSDMKDVFSLFDFKSDGTCATEDLGTVLRGLGYNLTEEQISDFINENDHDGSGKLDFATFYSIVAQNQPMRPASTLEEVEGFFEPFDLYHDGKIRAEDFVNLLQEMGEPLTAEDIHHLLREISIDGDNHVDFRAFARHMFETSAP